MSGLAARLAGRRAWVFDLDGTLTEDVHDFDAIRDALELPRGRPILEALDELPEHEAAPRRARLARLEAELVAAARPRAAALELLSTLHARGCRLGILTRNVDAVAQQTLVAAGLARWFAPADVVGRERAAPKPDPAGIELLLSRWNVPPEQALMVGDFHLDLATARAAGVLAVHLELRPDPAADALADVRVAALQPLVTALGECAA